ncbi:hypothetical protein R4144_12765 [Gordonia amicalis]|uniref:hypothetical protein n=1 Tax=Gordonia amicalis TaxID=89053 RepID=UPI002954C49D|nr:hypothetical protein [Gordonia amicalis]MDV7174231.1 hypothetical protein [Gordonia amicalis]
MTLTYADLTDSERRQLGHAVHEAGHAVAATIFGGRIERAELEPARTTYAHVPAERWAEITFAGPWASARYAAGGPPSSMHLRAAMAEHQSDAHALTAAGDYRPREVPRHLSTCWGGVIALARRIYVEGSAGHEDVLAALQLPTDRGDDLGVELASIRAGSWPVSILRPAEGDAWRLHPMPS